MSAATPAYGMALFDTALGRCGIAWGPVGIVGLQLPGRDDDATRARLRALRPRMADAPVPEPVRRACAAVARLLRGDAAELRDVPLDMEAVPPFDRSVYAAARAVAPGATVTYGELARRCGTPGAARAVGGALARNPFAVIVPCHRVVAAAGRPGGFSAPGGVAVKMRLLAIERSAGSTGTTLPVHPG
jgi:methylated-DNA-[protein]-cysteine S-methyltransferase